MHGEGALLRLEKHFSSHAPQTGSHGTCFLSLCGGNSFHWPGGSRQCGLTHARECSTPPPMGHTLLLRINLHKYCTLPGCHEWLKPYFLKETSSASWKSLEVPVIHRPIIPALPLVAFSWVSFFCVWLFINIYHSSFKRSVCFNRRWAKSCKDISFHSEWGGEPLGDSDPRRKISWFSPLAAMKRLRAKDREEV